MKRDLRGRNEYQKMENDKELEQKDGKKERNYEEKKLQSKGEINFGFSYRWNERKGRMIR